jgi:hypothetical protein
MCISVWIRSCMSWALEHQATSTSEHRLCIGLVPDLYIDTFNFPGLFSWRYRFTQLGLLVMCHLNWTCPVGCSRLGVTHRQIRVVIKSCKRSYLRHPEAWLQSRAKQFLDHLLKISLTTALHFSRVQNTTPEAGGCFYSNGKEHTISLFDGFLCTKFILNM